MQVYHIPGSADVKCASPAHRQQFSLVEEDNVSVLDRYEGKKATGRFSPGGL